MRTVIGLSGRHCFIEKFVVERDGDGNSDTLTITIVQQQHEGSQVLKIIGQQEQSEFWELLDRVRSAVNP